ncbi:1569_t:CDS:2 [Gigaspora rosea]|nr:1569_t:CDS:2 [Gigaspora rosea]
MKDYRKEQGYNTNKIGIKNQRHKIYGVRHWDNKEQNKENHLAKKKAILDLHANKTCIRENLKSK